MANIFTDTFTDSNNVHLEDHDSDWKQFGDGYIKIYSNYAKGGTSGLNNYVLDIDPTSADYEVSVDYTFGYLQWFDLGIRYQSLENYYNCYQVSVKDNGDLTLRRISNGSGVNLDTYSASFSSGNTYHITIRAVGSTISVFVDGKEVMSGVSAHHTAKGYPALGIYSSTQHLDNFSVDTLASTKTVTVTAKAKITLPVTTKTVTTTAKAKITLPITTYTKTIESLANIKNSYSNTIETKANIFKTNTKTVESKGYILKEGQKIITAKANILQTQIYNINAKANIFESITTQTKTTTTKAKICHISTPILVQPIGSEEFFSPLYLVIEIPTDYLNRNMHIKIQVDKTDDTFADLEIDLVSFRDSGFEYWDGADWQEYPILGVDYNYYGNQVRVQVNLTIGQKYWRAKGIVK